MAPKKALVIMFSRTPTSTGKHLAQSARDPKVRCPYHPDVHLLLSDKECDVVCPKCGLVVARQPFHNSLERLPGLVHVEEEEWHTYTKHPSRRGDLTTMISQLSLPRDIINRTNNLSKQVYGLKGLKECSNDAIASACLYIACRQEGFRRTFKDICAVSWISKKEIGRCVKLILNALETSMDLITAELMSRFSSNLGLSKQVERAATFITRKAVELNMSPDSLISVPCSPISVVAAAIYLASQASAEKTTLKEIVAISGMADILIRQSYLTIYDHAAELFPPDFRFDTPLDKLPEISWY